MKQNSLQNWFFSATCTLTKYFPRAGARVLDFPIRSIVGSRFLSWVFNALNRMKLREVRTFRRFLVHPDIHIGDAIMAQAAVSALRDFFPDAEIDFIANRSVMPLIEGNPEVNRFLPMYAGGAFPSDAELAAVGDLLKEGRYDLCINANPFLTAKQLGKRFRSVFDFTSHAPTIIRNEKTSEEVNHIVAQYRRFVHDLLGRTAAPSRDRPYAGCEVRLPDVAIEEATQFLAGSISAAPLVLMNTDTASAFTRIPFAYQVALATGLLEGEASLLIGAGHTEPGIGERLLAAIPTSLRSRARLIPAKMSLPTYSALSDRCDLFITGDTGPMHIAAARKLSRTDKYVMRNRTALLCVFGATPARMSGYDSFQPGYLASNQDAPSWTIVAGSPCRNITCLNKMFKTCETVRCFEVLDVAQVGALLKSHLRAASGL